MMDWADYTNFAFAVAGITIMLAGLFMTIFFQTLNPWIRRFFIIMYAILIAYASADLLSQISLNLLGPDYGWLSKTAIFLESLFSSLTMPLLTVLLLYSCKESRKKNPLVWIVSGLWILYMILLLITQFTDIIYSVSNINVYQRGPLYPLLLVPPVLLMIVNFFALLKRRTLLTKREKWAFFSFILIPLIAMIVQMVFYGLLLIVIGTSISAFIMFLFLMRDQAETMRLQQEENARAQARIAVLAMRPHFIYNTLSTVYYLCKVDPEKAQEVVGDFTTYLRKNLSAIVKEGLIPFGDELEHTKAYLAVEKARYSSQLFVTYDTPYTAFHLPPLTLQPIVENAVKHGLDPEQEPLQIRIRTRQDGNEIRIFVEDSGVGFDTGSISEENSGTDGSHIGLSNIRERLKSVQGSSLEIKPREGGGTSVLIRLPQNPAIETFHSETES